MQTLKLIFALVAALLVACSADADTIDDIVREAMERQKIAGLSLAVLKDGKIVRAKGYGWANIEWKMPAKADTVFQIGSVTKQFTATAIMMLVEDGKLSLDDPLVRFVPSAPVAWRDATVRQMLNHTSGIPSDTEPKGLEKFVRDEFTPEKSLAFFQKSELEFTPGTRWNYSNMGYYLLGLIIEKVSGKPYGDFLKDRIFQPLGMNDTRINDLQAIVPRRASGYLFDAKGYGNWEPVHPALPYAAGAMLSTVVDLAKWNNALATGKLLKPATQEQMWTPTRLGDGKTENYGFGWSMDTEGGQKRIFHPGGIFGFSSVNLIYPEARLSVIILCNQMTGLGGIATAIANTQLPAPPNARPVTIILHNRPEAKQVSLAGDFNGWSPTPMKRRGKDWMLTIKIAPGKHHYKFVTDDQWITDPANPETAEDGRGNVNSVLLVTAKN